MDLEKYNGKYVRLKDKYGNVFEGRVSHGGKEFLFHEYGGDEDGVFIDYYLVYDSQIESIEEIVPHGTAELWTENLILRRYLKDKKTSQSCKDFLQFGFFFDIILICIESRGLYEKTIIFISS